MEKNIPEEAMIEAEDGAKAMKIAMAEDIDLFLVDWNMPNLDGLAFVKKVRALDLYTRTPIIMITSRSTGKHRQEAKAAGVDVYLTKPFSEDELLQHLAELGGGR